MASHTALLSSPNQDSCESELGKNSSVSSICLRDRGCVGWALEETTLKKVSEYCPSSSPTIALSSPLSWVLGTAAFLSDT